MIRTNLLRMCLATWVVVLLAPEKLAAQQAAQEELSSEKIARLLSQTTVTLRVVQKAPREQQQQSVTVFSGVSLGEGLLVSAMWPQGDGPLRVTLVGGKQALAVVEVWDQYSGLCLLKLQGGGMPGLKIWEGAIRVGQRVFTGAASGVAPPLVSAGIIGGVDRVLPGTGLPPLLQCDLRTSETSTGAAVVDTRGRLVGILALADDGPSGGWAWAVPARHVLRLLRARVPGKKVVLKRRRPVLGCVMQHGERAGEVLVQRLLPGGPAEKAGLKLGDQILQADGIQVRSVYQVVSLVLKKQPGDRITLLVRRGERTHRFTVTLGGGEVLEPQQWAQRIKRSPRTLQIGVLGRQVYRIQTQGAVQQQALPPEAALFAEQARRFAAYIEILRRQLRQRDEQLRRQQEQIRKLQRQFQQLQRQLQSLQSRQATDD